MQRLLTVLLFTVGLALASGVVATRSHAARDAATACNLRGSWVASHAETNRYFQALNPTTGDISIQSGALVATFTRTQFTFGGIGLVIVGHRGSTTIKEEVDLNATAGYTVRGSTIHLGPGSYKLVHVHTTLTTAGKTKSISLPTFSLATPGKDVPYSCTPRRLRLTVVAGRASVPLTLARERR
ncbi:MAG: hypothetical protein U0R50_13330 [Gaiellales bacterium]